MPRKPKILTHPDKEQIIKWMTEGVPIREIEYRINKKYWNRKELKVSVPTLQNFRKENLKLDKKVIQDIRESKSTETREKLEADRITALQETSAYQDKINAIADTHLDVAKKILQLDSIIESRMEYWYNAIKTGDANPDKADKEMRQYMDRQMLLLQQYKKFVEGMADKTIDYNVNITVLNDQIEMIKNVIKDVLRELDPETSIAFMDKFNKKLNEISYTPSAQEKVNVKTLNAMNAEIVE